MAFLQNLIKPNFGRILTSVSPAASSIFATQNEIFTTQKRFAARKGKRIAATRTKQKLARQRREEQKNAPPKVWKPKSLSMDKKLNLASRKFNDDDRRDLNEIYDNVYVINQYKERKHPFDKVLEWIRETHDPSMYGEQDALIHARVELDLRTKRKTKFLERIHGLVSYPNRFEYGFTRKVVVICKTDEDIRIANHAGAEMAGSSDLIQMLKNGTIKMQNFDDLICHGDMLVELATIKGHINDYFPTKQRGNIGFDIERLVKHFVNGVSYSLVKDGFERDYGYCKVPFGRLTQSDEELRHNFEVALKSVEQHRPQGVSHEFISRVLLQSEPCPEMFPTTFWDHISGYENPYEEEGEEDENEVVKASASN